MGVIVVLLCLGAVSGCAPSAPEVEQAIGAEQADRLPLTAFYDTPSLAATEPGDLLRQEPGIGYDLPAGVTATRILYHSQDASGADVATSGVVLVPPGPVPGSGWPVIAWAHGTSGVARMCAPSLMKDVYYGEEGLFPMVRAGYAVVATDYHGLGTEGPHQYSNRAAQTHDVIHSIPAARQAVPDLGTKWVVDGHSQGGVAAWGVDQAEHALSDEGFLGAVSVAGAVQGDEFARHLASAEGAGFYLAFMAAGIEAVDPSFDPSSMLSSAAMEMYDEVTTNGCLYRAVATYEDVAQPARAEWTQLPAVRGFFDALTPTADPLAAPLLVIAGGADETVPISGVRKAVAAACATGQPVTFRAYPGLDHDPAMDESTGFQLRWIGRRFAGQASRSTCH
jgi:alpha-beta hydrolase superfamily lysophospholipase